MNDCKHYLKEKVTSNLVTVLGCFLFLTVGHIMTNQDYNNEKCKKNKIKLLLENSSPFKIILSFEFPFGKLFFSTCLSDISISY